MRDTPRTMRSDGGSALLEVMLAVAMMAVTGLGLIITQLSLARNTQWATARERAAFIADAIAESAQHGATGNPCASQWKVRMATILPGGALSTTTSGANTSIVTVTWPATSLQITDHAAAMPVRLCASANVPAGRACVAIAFAS